MLQLLTPPRLWQILARKELNYGRMDERDLRQLTEEVCVCTEHNRKLAPNLTLL